MTEAEAPDPRTTIRRSDRGKDDPWIREYLREAPFGFLAMVKEGQPFVNSNLFVYEEDEHAIFMHTARTGRTPTLLAEPTQVAFSVAAMGRMLPADEALEFSIEYSGVTVFGSARTIEGATEAERVLQLILDKYAPHLRSGEHYRSITPEELTRTGVYRIDIEAWSGKEKFVEPDFPGAFSLDPIPVPFRQVSE